MRSFRTARLGILVTSLALWAPLHSTARAQQPAAEARPSIDPVETIARWLSMPTQIQLRPVQKPAVDSLDAEFRRKVSELMHAKPPRSEMAIVRGMSDLNRKYQAAVRRELTEEQRVIFDRNVAADQRRP